MVEESMINRCEFSQDRKYRYRLDFDLETDDRDVLEGEARIAWILLNPSTADELTLDPTLRRVRDFSRDFPVKTVTIVNLFAWRATRPRVLKTLRDPVGPDNDRHILEALEGSSYQVLAWGGGGRLAGRGRAVEALLKRADVLDECLVYGYTKRGDPRHPLYLRGDLAPAHIQPREQEE
jgi:hypothetical protein